MKTLEEYIWQEKKTEKKESLGGVVKDQNTRFKSLNYIEKIDH